MPSPLSLLFSTFVFAWVIIVLQTGNCSSASVETLLPVQTFPVNASKVVTEGEFLIVANIDVQVWSNNANVGTKILDIETHYSRPIKAMAALGGFLYAVTSNGPKSIRKWNYTSGALMWRAPYVGNSHDDLLTDLVVSSSGVYTSSIDGTIKQWSIADGNLVAIVQTAIGPSGFVAPITKLFLDRAKSHMYASFGRYKPLDGVGRATLLPGADFEGLTTGLIFASTGSFGSWSSNNGTFAYNETHIGEIAASGAYFVMGATYQNASSTEFFLKRTISVVPGNTYQLRFMYAKRDLFPFPTSNNIKINGQTVQSDFNYGAFGAQRWYQVTSAVFQATGKAYDVAFTCLGCSAEHCRVKLDFIELVLVQRNTNIDNADVFPVADGGFESIVVTDTSFTYTGAFGNWTKTNGAGTVAIAKVGSSNFFNLPAAGGTYALWMATVVGDDTTVSQEVSLEPGTTYVVRWHFAMRQVRGASTTNIVSSMLNVSLCGTVVAGRYSAPSLLFEEASSSTFTPVGTIAVTCNLSFTILRGATTLRNLLIDEVELVRVRNPNLVPSGSFEGLTDTATSWTVYPGMMGNWMSSGDLTGSTAVVRIPSTECSNAGTMANRFVLWMQSSKWAPGTSVSVEINTLELGATYVVRWSYARRMQGATIFDSPELYVNVFDSTVSSGLIPMSGVFETVESEAFVAISTTTILTLTVSTESTTKHMLIDNVELVLVKTAVVAGSPPLVKEYVVDASLLTFVRDYTLPEPWMATLPMDTVADFSAMATDSGFLYAGISLSSPGSLCHVLKYDMDDGAYVDSLTLACDGSSVRSMMAGVGHLLVGHVSSVSQLSLLLGGTLLRVLDWNVGASPIMDMTMGGPYLIASGNSGQALKWRLPEWVVTTTTTTSTTTSTTHTSTAMKPTTSSSSGQKKNPNGDDPGPGELSDTVKIIAGGATFFVLAVMVAATVYLRRRRKSIKANIQQAAVPDEKRHEVWNPLYDIEANNSAANLMHVVATRERSGTQTSMHSQNHAMTTFDIPSSSRHTTRITRKHQARPSADQLSSTSVYDSDDNGVATRDRNQALDPDV